MKGGNIMLGDSRDTGRYQVNEIARTYIFPGDDILEFNDVESIAVSDSGNHYLNLKDGRKVIVRCGWLCIIIQGEWVA